MKTLFIVMAVLTASLSTPTQMDYIPESTPATPNPEIYAMGIQSDPIDLNTICGWQETIVENKTVLTLYTYDGNFYVLETETVSEA